MHDANDAIQLLYLGIAVQGPADAAFTVVGKQKLQMVPFAARAAAAKDYKVTGDLTVGNDVIATGEVQGASADFTGLMASGSVDTGHIDADTVELNMGNGGVAFENSGTGLDIRALSNPSSGEPLFRVLSSGYAERLRVDHDGTLFTEDNIDANGNINGESMTSEGSISGTQLNVGSPSIDADATLNVEGNVNMIGGTFDGSGLYGLSNGPSGTATTDGFIVYWAYRALAGSHLRMSGESPINTRLIYNSHRVEAGDITVNGMFPVRKGETWMVRNMTSNAATINYAFIALGQ